MKSVCGMLFFVLFLASSCMWGEPSLHPDFSITKKELEKAVQSLSPGIQERILKSPKEFLSLLEGALEGEQELLVVVDKTHALGKDFEPEGLVRLDTQHLRAAKAGLALGKEALDALVAMTGAARDAGIALVAGSTYRSYADQESVYAYWVKTLGQKQADRESATPGHSQHQLGTTIDFSPIDDSFASTAAAPWLAQYAWRYGFSMSYPDGYEDLTGYKYEPWHFRFIGRDAAALVENYFLGIQSYFLSFYESSKDFFLRKMNTAAN